MKGTIQDLDIYGYKCSLYLPQGYHLNGMKYPVVYINGEDDIYDMVSCIERHFETDCKTFILLSVQPKDWNDDYTPWAAPPLTNKSKPFGGSAASYIQFLSDNIKPFMDKQYKTMPEPENNALIGYSLSGLAALYSLYICQAFGMVGSLSGSLWYDGWEEFMESNMPVSCNTRVYISLGNGEEHSRNQRMARVGDCTRKAAEILKRQLIHEENFKLEWNNGGHFAEIPARYERAILWLMSK